jgi:NAD(P)-dependent dehydrogenase (short-subunit alcohol dehydrogenase family)
MVAARMAREPTPMGELEGKVALVTGAASGIGLATARRLADEGASVVVVDRDADGGAKAAADVGGRFEQADVGSPEDWARVVASVTATEGRLDLAYLNAGVTTGENDVTQVTDEQYRRIVGANVDGVFYGLRAVVPAIAAAGGGAVVATASIAGLIDFAPDPVYTLTKHAVVGFIRASAPQLAEKGITCNAVCPGIVDTPLVGDEAKAFLKDAGFPLIRPEDIADAVFQAMTGSETGQAFVVQAGREPTAYRFGRVPGPRAKGAEGMAPPAGMAGPSQLD